MGVLIRMFGGGGGAVSLQRDLLLRVWALMWATDEDVCGNCETWCRV
jgi:hypothetical protein